MTPQQISEILEDEYRAIRDDLEEFEGHALVTDELLDFVEDNHNKRVAALLSAKEPT